MHASEGVVSSAQPARRGGWAPPTAQNPRAVSALEIDAIFPITLPPLPQ